jgi:hypothetical protein
MGFTRITGVMTIDALIATNNLTSLIKDLEQSILFIELKHSNRLDLIESINLSIKNLKRVRADILELDMNIGIMIKLREWN